MEFSILVYNYLKGDYFEEVINEKCGLLYAEDLVFKLVSLLKINSIGAHLFSLYEPNLDIWLCQNQKLSSLRNDLKLSEFKFNLKIRFILFSPDILYEYDWNAFDYYFYQLRDDFLNYPKKKFESEELSSVLGIAIQDALRVVFEKNIAIDDNYDCNIEDYLPKNMVWPKFSVKSKIKETFIESYQNIIICNLKIDKVIYIKCCYIQQYLENLASNFYDEIYKVDFYSLRDQLNKNQVFKKSITFLTLKQEVCIRNNKGENWQTLFSISELLYLTLMENHNLQISRVNNPPINIVFDDSLHLKSFISLLSGYYRLCERWNFNICHEYFSPWISRLRKICCHGPISREFACEKLHKNCDPNNVNYSFIFQQSRTNLSTFYIIFEEADSIKTYNLTANLLEHDTSFFLEDYKKRFNSHIDLFEFLRNYKKLCSPIIPSENDQLDLLLSRNKKTENKNLAGNFLPVIPLENVKMTQSFLYKNRMFCIRFGRFNRETKVTIKEFINKERLAYFLKELSTWVHLNDMSLVNCKGIIIEPLSALFECCQTSLRDLYRNGTILKPVNLIEAIYFLSKALDYLYSQGVVHGYIRFDNLYVSHYSEKSLCIKLGDPIGYLLNSNDLQEKSWLPPEYFKTNSNLCNKLTTFSDVWAFGTTVWQIFTNGNRPDFSFENIDTKISSLHHEIPDSVCQLVIKCWTKDCNDRIQPLSIFRDLCRILTECYESLRRNHYQTIVNEESHFSCDTLAKDKNHENAYYQNIKDFLKKSNVFKSRRSSLSISNTSIHSDHTDTTLLNSLEDALSICTSSNANPLKIYEVERIHEDQLVNLEKIGEGHYGKVFKANLQKPFCQNITVALKILFECKGCNLDHEIEIMTKLKHKNIVQLIGYCFIGMKDSMINDKGYVLDSFNFERSKALVMEYVEFGSLSEYLKRKYLENVLDLPFVKFASDIADGMAFLASKNIIHRDLAARNILVKSANHVKISDFGLAHFIKEEDQYKVRSLERSIPVKWYAPESITNHIFKQKSDVWSYAVLLWEIYTFCQLEPYESIEYSRISYYLEQGNRLPKPDNCPDFIYSIMLECWEYIIDKRPPFEIIRHKIEQGNSEQF